MILKKLYALILGLSVSTHSFAESQADSLLSQLGEQTEGIKIEKSQETKTDLKSNIELDAFQRFFLSRARQEKLSFDTQQWVNLIAESKFAQAAHLWTSISNHLPKNFHHEAQSAQLYLLWKLNLNQTFFEQWITSLVDPSYMKSASELVLEQLCTANLDAWLLKSNIIVSPKHLTLVSHLPPTRSFVVTLNAWAHLRDEKQAEEFLAKLPIESKLISFLAETALLGHVQRGDLKGAARLIKKFVEPNIASNRDMELLARLDLTSARILYQAGQLKAAVDFYLKIPNQSTSYLIAREELAWAYLRLNDSAHLRGEIMAFFTPALQERFQPEVYILRAISDLKLCFYDRMDKDLADFTKANLQSAKAIDQAMSATTPPAPLNPDIYSKMAESTARNLQSELQQLNQLGEQSIGAVLPAVGEQKHWKEYQANLQANLNKALKNKSDEYIRQWKNQRLALQESIRKMRFVKVEYISQVRSAEMHAREVVDKKNSLASNSNFLPAAAVTKNEPEMLNFPADSELWPDEFFKLRSAAQSLCLRKAGANK